LGRTVFRLAGVLLLGVGCRSIPFRQPRLEPIGAVDAVAVRDAFARSVPPRLESEDSLVCRFLWHEIAALSYTSVDREDGSLKVQCLNHMGFELFLVQSRGEELTVRSNIPELAAHPGLIEGLGRVLRFAYLDLVPAPDAVARLRSDRVVFRQSGPDGTVEHVFGGVGNRLLEKRWLRHGRLAWKVSFYEYAEGLGAAVPGGVVIDDRARHYRLLIRTRKCVPAGSTESHQEPQ
jgi:hypothetical protein